MTTSNKPKPKEKGDSVRILVFDDNKTNREAARAQLKDHDLTVVSTYDEAQELLTPRFDNHKQEMTYPNFDVVLVDLLVPASQQAQISTELVGKEMPVGIFIGLVAAVKGHAKYVAIFTDSDHHSHPASACFDIFNEGDAGRYIMTPFLVEGSKMLLSNERSWVNQFDPSDLSKALGREGGNKRTNTVRAKNWRKLLDYLTT